MINKGLFLIILILSGIFAMPTVYSAEEFIDLQCLSDIKTKYPCNVSLYRKFLKINFPRSGRSNKIRYSNIIHWNYSDSSLRKMDADLASRIGVIGLLFRHEYLYPSISTCLFLELS